VAAEASPEVAAEAPPPAAERPLSPSDPDAMARMVAALTKGAPAPAKLARKPAAPSAVVPPSHAATAERSPAVSRPPVRAAVASPQPSMSPRPGSRILARATSDSGGGGGGGGGGQDSDLIYTEVMRRVRQEQEQLGQLISHPF